MRLKRRRQKANHTTFDNRRRRLERRNEKKKAAAIGARAVPRYRKKPTLTRKQKKAVRVLLGAMS